jgi:hypothetical protein
MQSDKKQLHSHLGVVGREGEITKRHRMHLGLRDMCLLLDDGNGLTGE